MRQVYILLLLILLFAACNKHTDTMDQSTCNIQQVYTDNAKKITITQGAWGTVSSIEGNCMPTVPACNSCCSNCPVQRTVRIYKYTLRSNASPNPNNTSFYDAFNSPLIAEVHTDNNGFFQANLPAGQYSIAIIENGKLYCNSIDGAGGLGSFSVLTGTTNINVAMTYKATF